MHIQRHDTFSLYSEATVAIPIVVSLRAWLVACEHFCNEYHVKKLRVTQPARR